MRVYGKLFVFFIYLVVYVSHTGHSSSCRTNVLSTAVPISQIGKIIFVFHIPFYNDDRAEAKRRRKRWVDFVKLTRDKWVPTAHSAVCSEHFTPESYEQRFNDLTGQTPRLLKDSFGITVFPTVNKLRQPEVEQSISARDRRMVSIVLNTISTLLSSG